MIEFPIPMRGNEEAVIEEKRKEAQGFRSP